MRCVTSVNDTVNIVRVDEELEVPNQPLLGLGESQSFLGQPGELLPEGVVEALKLIGFSHSFLDTAMKAWG